MVYVQSDLVIRRTCGCPLDKIASMCSDYSLTVGVRPCRFVLLTSYLNEKRTCAILAGFSLSYDMG